MDAGETVGGSNAGTGGGVAARIKVGCYTGWLSTDTIVLLTRAVQKAADELGDAGWVQLSVVKSYLTQFKPDFNVQNCGFMNMKSMLLSEPGHFECKCVDQTSYYIRLIGW